ncbi:MAG: U32 family peptidase [Erysipelotrichaceae bacterium]|nr:U32 family peptidase [Erysipelotrichaceae bacterium]
MTDWLVTIRDIANIEMFRELGIDTLIVADERFSSSPCGLSRDQLAMAVAKIRKAGLKAAIRIDRLFYEDELADLESYLRMLDQLPADLIICTDIGVKQIADRIKAGYQIIYAPETLLTNGYEIESLKRDGMSGCVISKDITIREVYDILRQVPDYCYLKVHGPVLLSYSGRGYISSYLERKGNYLEGWHLVEETRSDVLPIVEKNGESWLYWQTLQSFSEISYLLKAPLKGLIIDNNLYKDEYTLKTVSLYRRVMAGEISGSEALEQLKGFDRSIKYLDINDLKATWLQKG